MKNFINTGTGSYIPSHSGIDLYRAIRCNKENSAKFNGPERGFTLIELMVALAVGVLVVSALTVAIVSALQNVEFGKDQNLATAHAQQTMETIRRTRDQNWTAFSVLSGSNKYYCVDKNNLDLTLIPFSSAPCLSPNVGSFIREAQIGATSKCTSSGALDVVVRVKWTDGKCPAGSYCHKVELSSCLNNLYAVPTL